MCATQRRGVLHRQHQLRRASYGAAAVNWALAKEGITPTGTALRNVKLSELPKAKAGGKPGKLFLAANGMPGSFGADVAGWESMGGATYEVLYEEVTAYMGAQETLYIEDAALGSYASMALPTRAITDDPGLAAFIKGSLCTMTADVSKFQAAVTIYAAPGFTPTGVTGPFAAVNIERGEVILAGGASGSTLGHGVAPVADHYNAQQGVAPLSGTCAVIGGNTVVVCTPGPEAPAGVPGTAFSYPVVWGEDGIWSLFNTTGACTINRPLITMHD